MQTEADHEIRWAKRTILKRNSMTDAPKNPCRPRANDLAPKYTVSQTRLLTYIADDGLVTPACRGRFS